ncbi:hypothetical protein NQ176_g5234 [Zarea fungicola]|uniref:Uncharacterized protein n=1 Tax=Zarea fungicola TaxID=93591 RepID=A0ACC1N9K5_9HYPO|nr:hypothetical protein NQ176_g5234 [Lecanicillium fungicola]
MIPVYWRIYKENFDCLAKILHVPTTEILISSAASGIDNIVPSTETLLFAIYFAAVVAIPPEECLQTLGHPKGELFSHYSFAVQKSFEQVSILETHEFIVLQAFTIYLIAVQFHCSSKRLSTLTAVLVRLAQGAGIHCDGSRFGQSPFETEMRRRLWWHIRLIDARASEEAGCDATIRPGSSSTAMPLNINDVDLTPAMTVIPASRMECTDMTFSLLRFEAILAFEAISQCGKLGLAETIDCTTRSIMRYQNCIRELVPIQPGQTNPFYWYTAIVSRIILNQLWLVAYYPYLQVNSYDCVSSATRDDLFSTAIYIMQSQLLLYNGTPTRRWSWLCATQPPWHAMTYILTELCKRKHGCRVEAAWNTIDSVLEHDPETDDGVRQETSFTFSASSRLGKLWENDFRPLNELLASARAAKANADTCSAI